MAADDGTPAGLIGLLSRTVADHSSGTRVERQPDPEHLALIDTTRNALIEGIIAESEDESLMDRYLGGEDIDLKVLIDDLRPRWPAARSTRSSPPPRPAGSA
jgi:elongation factor G